MPYIPKSDRQRIYYYDPGYSGGPERLEPPEPEVGILNIHEINNVGELNYAITELINDYWKNNPRYQTGNDIVGALECAKLEFYRRVLTPYEEEKIVENGDVY